ncbi:hypothetical protein GCM10010399_59090 [Dactylosporangium fulvum]|uniref:Uncharacterized protein n=1 Tax=Dactylosporangium fulvum TaxID=53359 RepID=A0ABY5VPM2_9ACTN|nr:hypothetical protein [Dactylosporangium fulvum]UWP78996.1 hypothetical protein Dfulv_27935 [Dactylosporangium fulvum]
MADVHELMVAVDLRGDLAEPDLAELRWHLGLGPRPEHVTAATIVVNDVLDLLTDEQAPVRDESGNWVIKEFPEPAWHDGSPYAAAKMPGVGLSTLVHVDDRRGGRWALTCRWEVHPDGHAAVAELLGWLAARLRDSRSFFGYQRWYEDDEPEPLGIQEGKVVVRRKGTSVPPFWDESDVD